jgi:LPXTG-motif cell wall-anchored protein
VGFVLLISSLITLTVGAPAFAAVATVVLGTAATYSVLASTGVVNTLASTLSGDLGLSSSGTISGFPPGVVSGTTNDKNSAAAQAETDRLAAYNDASGRTPSTPFSGDQNGKTFGPGVHSTAAAFSLTGEMILDGKGDSGAIFIFQVAAALNTAAGSEVTLTGDALPENVFWQVNGAAGIGANSSFAGTILAAGAITLGNGVTLKGKALSGGTVTLIDDTVVTEQPSTSPSEARGVSATAGNTSAVVSWSAPTSDGGSVITGYTVTSSPGGLTATTTGATTTTATVSGLTNGTPYTFRVVATNAVGGSPPSAASVAVTPAAASSPAPTPAPTPAPEGSTVDGGVLPDTGPNDWLIALGVGLAIALGAALLLLRAGKSH